MAMDTSKLPAPQCREWKGKMKPNKTYQLRQAYWWVFTYPGSLCGAVLEIREARNHGSTFKTRRFAVTEKMPDDRDCRVFIYYKPHSDRKPTDDVGQYTVRFSANQPRLNRCGCESFQRRSTCAHLDSLLCLVGPKATATRVDKEATPDPRKTEARTGLKHDWEPYGKKSYRCDQCGSFSYDPALTDNHPDTRDCRPKVDDERQADVPGARGRSRPAKTPVPARDRSAGTGRPAALTGPSRAGSDRGKAGPRGKTKRPGKAR
jgi:hypothetical protein